MCPEYMVFGMTYEQFWYGDPYMAETFREYYLLKRKVENENMWLQGGYFYAAISAALATAFGKKQERYLSKPQDVFQKTKAEKEIEVREERKRIIRYLSGLKAAAPGSKQQNS